MLLTHIEKKKGGVKYANIDPYAVKAMVGHKISDITESTYAIIVFLFFILPVWIYRRSTVGKCMNVIHYSYFLPLLTTPQTLDFTVFFHVKCRLLLHFTTTV